MHYRVVGLVPVSNENRVVTRGIRERDRNSGPAEDPDTTESAGSLVEGEGREVVEAPDLVFHLHDVGKVPARRDRACRAVHPILVRVPPLLDATPGKKDQKKTFINFFFGRNVQSL